MDMQGQVGIRPGPARFSHRVEGDERLDRPPTAQQVDDENDQRYHQQQMDQASRHVQAKTQQPQNQKHYENCPKHISFSLSHRLPPFCWWFANTEPFSAAQSSLRFGGRYVGWQTEEGPDSE
jgi:hypothetical protein